MCCLPLVSGHDCALPRAGHTDTGAPCSPVKVLALLPGELPPGTLLAWLLPFSDPWIRSK